MTRICGTTSTCVSPRAQWTTTTSRSSETTSTSAPFPVSPHPPPFSFPWLSFIPFLISSSAFPSVFVLSLPHRYNFPLPPPPAALFNSSSLFFFLVPPCPWDLFLHHTHSPHLLLLLFSQSSGCRALSLGFPRQPPSCLEACVALTPCPLQHALDMHNTPADIQR